MPSENMPSMSENMPSIVEVDPRMQTLEEVAAERSEAASFRFRQRVAGRWAEQILEAAGVETDHTYIGNRQLGKSKVSPLHSHVFQVVTCVRESSAVSLGTERELRPDYRHHFGDHKVMARVKSHRVYDESFDRLRFGIGPRANDTKIAGYQYYGVENFYIFEGDEGLPEPDEHPKGFPASTHWEAPISIEPVRSDLYKHPESAEKSLAAFCSDLIRVANAAEIELVSPSHVYAYEI